MKRTLVLLAVTTLCASQPSRAAENSPVLTPPAPVVAAANGQTRTLADVARERKLGKKGVQGGTLSVAGAPVPLAGAGARAGAPAPQAGGTVATDTDEAVWTQRNSAARGELAAAQAALAQADAALPLWSVTGRGSAHSAALLNQIREASLLPYRTREADARAAVAALPEAARKAGAQPGWVRGDEVHADRKISLREMERQINNGDAPLPARDRDDRGTTR
jgi:hypothetical protein